MNWYHTTVSVSKSSTKDFSVTFAVSYTSFCRASFIHSNISITAACGSNIAGVSGTLKNNNTSTTNNCALQFVAVGY